MKKRILSLLLVMAMLLGVVPMIGAAEETSKSVWYGRSLTLGSGIAINFVTEKAVEDFGKVEFEVDGEVVQRYSTAEEDQTSFAFTRLTPSMLGKDVTAKMYNSADEVVGEVTTNVLSYCEAALDGDDAALKKLCVDLLNYGAATQAYVGSTDALVNADLTAEQQALGTSEYFPVKLATDLSFYDYGVETSATWYGAGLVLNDSITLCLQFTSEVEPGYVKVLDDGYTLGTITAKLVDEDEGLYEAYYNGLTPADFSVVREFIVCNANGDKISQKLYYSMESYAYSVMNDPTNYAKQVELIDALIAYCRSACEFNGNGHSYTYGVCDSCGVEKVFIMDSESITIEAQDAACDTSLVWFPENTNAADNELIAVQNSASGNGKTSSQVPGAVIVYVTPATTGTYKVEATGVYTAGSTYGVYVLVEDDTSDANQQYVRVKLPDEGVSSSYTSGTITSLTYGENYQWTAGKTYAIRVSSSSSKTFLDQFVITKQEEEHVHSTGDTWTTDETGHWKVCTGCEEKVDYAEHTYTNGVCECGAEETATIIQIAAKDATLNYYTNGYAALYSKTNANSTSGTLIQLNNRFSTLEEDNTTYFVYKDSTVKNTSTAVDQTVKHTGETDEGNIIVYVTPEQTGTYKVSAVAWVSGLGYTGVIVEDDNTPQSSYYKSVEFAKTKVGTETVNSGTVFGTTELATVEWTAGQTYAIRIISTNSNVALDYFEIEMLPEA